MTYAAQQLFEADVMRAAELSSSHQVLKLPAERLCRVMSEARSLVQQGAHLPRGGHEALKGAVSASIASACPA